MALELHRPVRITLQFQADPIISLAVSISYLLEVGCQEISVIILSPPHIGALEDGTACGRIDRQGKWGGRRKSELERGKDTLGPEIM